MICLYMYCIIISMYYLSKMSLSDIFTELTKLSIFPNDFRIMWYHLVYVYILIYLVYIK